MILTSWFAFVLKMTNIHIKKVLMDEKWSHEKHKTNEGFETLNFLHVQAFYFDGMFASQVNTNNVSINVVSKTYILDINLNWSSVITHNPNVHPSKCI